MHLITLYPILFWLWIASEVLAVLLTHTRRSTGETRDRGSLLILWPVIFCSTWGCMRYGYTHPHTIFGGAHWLVPVSFAIFALGLVLRWTSILSLGRSFSVNVAIRANQTLKTNGLYRFARHPSYTSMLIIFLGIGLETRNLDRPRHNHHSHHARSPLSHPRRRSRPAPRFRRRIRQLQPRHPPPHPWHLLTSSSRYCRLCRSSSTSRATARESIA